MKGKGLGERFTNPTVRDFSIVLLCGVMIYLLRARETYRLLPRWRQDVETLTYANGRYPNQDERLPSPIITDIESDGISEIVLITDRNHLQILQCPNATESIVLPSPIVKHQVELPLTLRDDGGRSFPVAMSAGFLVPYQSMVQIRKQVIVIATDDWHVLCYDHELNLLWTTRLMNIGQLREHYLVKSLHVLVTSINLHKKDDGLIIVGGSYEHKLHRKQRWSDISALEEDDTERHVGEDQSLTHFSTFAISGTNGTVRWHHLPGDFGEQQTLEKEIENAHHWKLALRRGHLHKGEMPWTVYKDDMLSILPHTWHSLEDTRFHLANIQRSRGKDPEKEVESTTLSNLIGLETDHLMGYAYGGLRPHSIDEHVKNPNTVVLHSQNGIEVLNLMSGQPVTKIKFSEGKTVYADTDGDGIIEEVFMKLPETISEGCDAVVMKYQQSSVKVFSNPLCESDTTFATFRRSMFGRNKIVEDPLHTVPAMLAKSVAKKTGITGMLHHLSGEGLRSRNRIWDLVFVTSSGMVKSYGTKGERHWEAQISSMWSDIYSIIREMSTRDSTIIDTYKNYFKPSMKPLSLQIFGKKNAALIVGWNEITLIDLRDGYILGSQPVPCQTHAPLVTGDFSSDGWTDFIYTCPIGYIGFSIEQEANYMYTGCIAVAVILVVLLLTWCCTPEEMDD